VLLEVMSKPDASGRLGQVPAPTPIHGCGERRAAVGVGAAENVMPGALGPGGRSTAPHLPHRWPAVAGLFEERRERQRLLLARIVPCQTARAVAGRRRQGVAVVGWIARPGSPGCLIRAVVSGPCLRTSCLGLVGWSGCSSSALLYGELPDTCWFLPASSRRNKRLDAGSKFRA
jgi:hypothetical protein